MVARSQVGAADPFISVRGLLGAGSSRLAASRIVRAATTAAADGKQPEEACAHGQGGADPGDGENGAASGGFDALRLEGLVDCSLHHDVHGGGSDGGT